MTNARHQIGNFVANSPRSHEAAPTEVALDQGLSTYYPNLHRDWCWGDAENAASLAAVRASLPDGAAPQRLLVIGAGACRLAYDLHSPLRSTSIPCSC